LNEDVDYFKSEVMVEMERAGIKYLAVVMPSGVFTRLTVKEMTADARTIEVKTFERMQEARAWLRSKNMVLL
jgi:hypothetical protein